jgi:hypothetical protein
MKLKILAKTKKKKPMKASIPAGWKILYNDVCCYTENEYEGTIKVEAPDGRTYSYETDGSSEDEDAPELPQEILDEVKKDAHNTYIDDLAATQDAKDSYHPL